MFSQIAIWNYSPMFEDALDIGRRYQKFFTSLNESFRRETLNELSLGKIEDYINSCRGYVRMVDKFEEYLLRPSQDTTKQAIEFICVDSGIVNIAEGGKLDEKELLRTSKSRFKTLLSQKSAFLAIDFPKIKKRKETIETFLLKLEEVKRTLEKEPREVYEFLKSRSLLLHGRFVDDNNQLVSRDIFLAILLAICATLISAPTTRRNFNFNDLWGYAVGTDAQWIYLDIKDDITWYVESWELAVISTVISAIERSRRLPLQMSERKQERFKIQLDECIREVSNFLSKKV